MTKHIAAQTILIAVAIMGINSARAGEPAAMASFRVEKGDTLMNLFGPDWQKAYQQNKVTVIRHGKPLTSPDILIEGSIITVTGDVRLTPKASTRITALNRQRNELRAKLAELAPKLTALPAAQAVVPECRAILDNHLRFAADLDFAAREIAHLERMGQNQNAPSQPAPSPAPVRWWIAVLTLIGVMIAIAIFWQRNQPGYPEGVVRCREALADVNAAFKDAGAEL